MRVRATINVEYDIPEETMLEAYGTADPDEVLQKERDFLDGEEGQGDYALSMLESADSATVTIARIGDDE